MANILAIITPSEKSVLEDLLSKGYQQLDQIEYFLEDHPNYDLVEIKVPFIEYTVQGERIRFITGKGVVQRVHVKNGDWIIM